LEFSIIGPGYIRILVLYEKDFISFLRKVSPCFHLPIAPSTAIKKISGKNADRFSFENRGSIFAKKRIPIKISKSDRDRKTGTCTGIPVVNPQNGLVQISLTFHNRIAIFPEKTDRVFHFKIDPRFSFFDRDHDRDGKFFRQKRGSIFTMKSQNRKTRNNRNTRKNPVRYHLQEKPRIP